MLFVWWCVPRPLVLSCRADVGDYRGRRRARAAPCALCSLPSCVFLNPRRII